MSDDEPDSYPTRPSGPSLGAMLTKLGYIFVAFFLVWLFLGQIGPRLMIESREKSKAGPEKTAPVPQAANTDENDDRLQRLEARLAVFENVMTPPPAVDTGAIDRRIAALEEKLAAIPVAAGNELPVDDERAERLEAKLDEQQQELQSLRETLDHTLSEQSRLLAATAAFGQVKDAARRGDPFENELARLKPHATDARSQSLIASLAAYAHDGLATLEKLQAGFEDRVGVALASGHGHTLKDNLTSLIRIRKVGEKQSGMDDESVLARAEAKLRRGDIESCLGELAALSPAAAAVFAHWTNEARSMYVGRVIVDELQLSLMTPAAAAP